MYVWTGAYESLKAALSGTEQLSSKYKPFGCHTQHTSVHLPYQDRQHPCQVVPERVSLQLSEALLPPPLAEEGENPGVISDALGHLLVLHAGTL